MEKTKIEWCDSSWNPVTGCRNDCPYCYARSIATRFAGCDPSPDGKTTAALVHLHERKKVTKSDGKQIGAAYPFGFTPTLHAYRLDDPVKIGFGKTVFVCSMGDLFGPWIPDEWIEKVFSACRKAMNHRYLFLTKYPSRYLKLASADKLPADDNFWYGSTTTTPDVEAFYGHGYHTFVSIEPILAPFGQGGEGGTADLVDWAIFGAETGNRKDKVVPKREWIEDAVAEFKKRGKPVFMKDSMIPIWGENILTEFPWEE